MTIRLTSGIYAKSLPIQRSIGLHDSGVRQDDTPTRKQLRYGDMSNIFERFSNGMAKIILEMAW